MDLTEFYAGDRAHAAQPWRPAAARTAEGQQLLRPMTCRHSSHPSVAKTCASPPSPARGALLAVPRATRRRRSASPSREIKPLLALAAERGSGARRAHRSRRRLRAPPLRLPPRPSRSTQSLRTPCPSPGCAPARGHHAPARRARTRASERSGAAWADQLLPRRQFSGESGRWVRSRRRAAAARGFSTLTIALALSASVAWAAGTAEPQLLVPSRRASPTGCANREGWFWYRDPPVGSRSAPPATSHRASLVEFEAMQKRLEDLEAHRRHEPERPNLTAYMRFTSVLVMDDRALRRALAAACVDRARPGLRVDRSAPTRWRSTSSTSQQRDRQLRAIIPGRHPRPDLRVPGDCPHFHSAILKR